MPFLEAERSLMNAHITLSAAAAPLTDPVRSHADAVRLIAMARARITVALDALMVAESVARSANRHPVFLSEGA